MVHIKAYKGSEIRRLEVEQGATFAQLKNLILQLFGLSQENTVLINYCDKDGDIIRLSSDAELQTALRHLGEDETWKLQIVVEQKHQQQSVQPQAHHLHPTVATWWDWNPFHLHHSVRDPFGHERLLDSTFGLSLWNDPFGFDHYDSLLQEQRRADLVRRNAMRQASVDAKRASDEVQAKSADNKQVVRRKRTIDKVQANSTDNKQGEVVKKPKMVYHHFGSWEPKVEKGDNYVITTYGPVGYKIHYSHDCPEDDTTGEKITEEPTKMEA